MVNKKQLIAHIFKESLILNRTMRLKESFREGFY